MKSISRPCLESNKFVFKGRNHIENSPIEFDGSFNIREEELIEEFWEEKKITFSIHSYSNIWWDEISFSKMANEIESDIELFNPPKNNRSYAYRMTPRLNSFIRELTKITLSFGGTIVLEDHKTENVIEEGVLLDNQIIYQEDVENGRIDLAEIDRRSLFNKI